MLAAILIVLLATRISVWSQNNQNSSNQELRILGGSDAPNGKYPYQVSIRSFYKNVHICGGSIIDNNWILTAAHCVYRKSPASLVVVVGSNSLSSGGTTYRLDEIILHPKFRPGKTVNDIALIGVKGFISYNSQVQPILLATPGDAIPAGSVCVLSGWGVTSYPSEEPPPDNLQQIHLTVVSLAQCQNAQPGFPVYTTNICTFQGVGYGSCTGDSGGPLVCNGEQHGILSWGIPCAQGNPDVYTSVSAYYQWIEMEINDRFIDHC